MRLALALLAALILAPAAHAAEPWKAAGTINDGLFAAQTELVLSGPDTAAKAVNRARGAYGGTLAAAIERADPDADEAITEHLRAAARAARRDDATALAAARGAVRAAVLRGAYAVTTQATARGDAATARRWLLLREFRTATRFTRPGAQATLALDQLARGKIDGRTANQAVTKDLLDAYQARLRELLADVRRGIEQDLPARRAEAAEQAAWYFSILATRYEQDRGAAARRAAEAAFAGLPDTLDRAEAALVGFTAAPFTPQEAARRAQQLLQFLELVPVEYGRGVKDTNVTRDFEIQEAVAFRTGAVGAFADLRDQLAKRDPARTKVAADAIGELGKLVEQANRSKTGVPTHEQVERVELRAETALKAAMPKAWTEETDESDYDLIALTLDRMEAAVGAGQYRQAEQARLEAYAFFEFGPERRLRSFDPGLALDVEGLIWFGAAGQDGLATQIAERAPRRAIRETRLALDTKLADSAATLGDSANKATVVTNSAIIVFREGLEGVLILAAITASMVGMRRRLRRPVFIGALAGLGVSIVTWILAQTLLQSLERYGEKLEAVVGLVAIGVLLLITNWFFHKVYWSEWIAKFHRQRKRYEKLERQGFISAQAIGLFVLGLTSVYREGFETVLFLQSLQLSAGTAAVVEGASLGLALTFAVGGVTFFLQRKLPYKKMLIVTGVFIGFVLVVMVGQTARTMQGTGWIPITPIDVSLPYWPGLWLGVYPTVETIGAQLAAAAFVIGSYFLAQEMKVKRPRRRSMRQRAGGTSEPERTAVTPDGQAAVGGDGQREPVLGGDPADQVRVE
ncbi:FTR1 family protein [Solirubrobacter sp. CPCC 204708]|uniref:FTR1 family protein n=1 Tax=Solirubrobacter deserti TaxID=2282478 RepID=A0ABT4RBJ9_9ACTN|nr:FTR1 family protein [Solirubrobacter deserti]MBE2317198.1 FTR1 family protein [Solirubrobacter deserti]MDA0135909.1 FTR1 family protein [Solirubrobacter deserti]